MKFMHWSGQYSHVILHEHLEVRLCHFQHPKLMASLTAV